METVDKLKYNDGEVLKLLWNGTEVSTLRHLGLQKEWSAGEVEPSFNVTLYGIGGGGWMNRYYNFSIDSEHLVQYLQILGATPIPAQFVLHLSGNRYGDVVLPSTTITNTNPEASLFDNKILVVKMSSGSLTFYPSEIPSIRKTFQIITEADEDESCRVGGMLTKTIRIPSIGYSGGNAFFEMLPYTFNDPIFVTDPVFTLLKKGNGNYNKTVIALDTTYSDTELSLTPSKIRSLDYNMAYEILPNTTGQYREWSVVCGDTITDSLTLNTEIKCPLCMLHFIQEFAVKNRIYWGLRSDIPDFDDVYRTTQNQNYRHHYFFETANSREITENEYSIEVGVYTKIAYPNDFDYTVDFGDVTYTILNNNYTWGDKTYTLVNIYGITGIKTITFRRK